MSINKKILIALLFVTIFLVDIGYAKFADATVLNETVNVNGDFNIEFENLEIVKSCGVKNSLPIVNENEIILNEIELLYPGAGIEYSVDIVNNGTMSAQVNDITINGNNDNNKIIVSVDEIKERVLKPNQKTNVHFRVIWDENANINANGKTDFTIKINYIQAF